MLQDWKHDLPANVMQALAYVTDSTWYIANKYATAQTIRWPISWTPGAPQEEVPPPARAPVRAQGKTLVEVFEAEEAKAKLRARLDGFKPTNGPEPDCSEVDRADQEVKAANRVMASLENVEQFEQFARKAALSPELAYLTILALGYRVTNDPHLLAKWRESKERVYGHLKAIKDIIGEL